MKERFLSMNEFEQSSINTDTEPTVGKVFISNDHGKNDESEIGQQVPKIVDALSSHFRKYHPDVKIKKVRKAEAKKK
jgi:hypothetical protein